MSLFGSIRKFFRADAAPVAQPPALAAPSRGTRHDMRSMMGGAASGFSNASSGYGMPGYDPRLSSQFSTGYMTDELATDMWRGSMLTGKIVSLLPSEAIEPGWDITIQDDALGAGGTPDPRDSAELVESVETRHRALGTEQIIRRACEWDRLFGGAAIWVGANDMLAQDWSEPLNLDAPNLRLNWLRVLRSRDLYPLAYYTDPNHPKHGEVAVWQLQPRTHGTVSMPAVQIHESRLHLFRGRRIVEDGTVLTQNQNSWEFGDGILLGIYGAIRRFEESLDNVELTMKANGEAVWQHESLADILAPEGGQEDFEKLVRAMDLAQSVLRARVIGAGQTFTRAGAPLPGLADLVTKFENELSAISSTPRTKLFGEAAGGLGSTGESQHGDWDETKATYRKENQTPAYEWITALILRTLGGLPKRWKVEGRKYRQLDAKQQAELTLLDAQTDIALAGAGIITADIVQQRAIWRDRYQLTAAPPEADMTGAIPDDIRDTAAGADPADPAAQDPAAAAPEGPKLADLALNGAQALALSAIVEKVAAGIMPRESGAQLVQFSFKVPAETAEKMMPPVGYKPAAVEGGLQEAPAAASATDVPAPPRADAADRTMDALIKKLAPSGKCDECGKRLPLEVDHVDGRGWAPRDVSKQQRTDRYWQEHDDGVKLRALCRSCNARDGALNKQGKSGPRHRSDAIDTGATLRFTYAPLPPEIVETMEALQAEVMPDGALAQEIDHVTLVFCPKAATDIPEAKVAEVVAALRSAAAGTAPIAAKVQGWAYFDGARKDGEDKTALVALIDAPGITQLQVRLQDALTAAGMEPSSAHSFAPHFTLCYLAPGERVDELPAIAAEFTIDRVCFANREVHEIQLGGTAAGQPRDPVETVEAITPFQLRALAGEPRDSLVATLELALGVPAAMADRLIPQSPGPSGVDPDDDDEDDEDLEDLDEDDLDDDDEEEDEDLEDEREDSDDPDSDDPDPVDPDEIEERDDCDNPIRGEGGLFDGCAPGEGTSSGGSPLHSRGPKPAAEKPPAKKLTPKQRLAVKAKAVRAKTKVKVAKEKAKLKAKKEKARAKIKAIKEKAKAKIAAAKAKKVAAVAAKKADDKAFNAAKKSNPKLTRRAFEKEKKAFVAKATAQESKMMKASKPGTAAEENRREQERLGVPEKKTGKTLDEIISAAKSESASVPTGKEFGNLANNAAKSVPEGKKFGEKVFISDAFAEAKKEQPSLTMDEFKAGLLKANRDGDVRLARADLIGAFDQDSVNGSKIESNGASFHFIIPSREPSSTSKPVQKSESKSLREKLTDAGEVSMPTASQPLDAYGQPMDDVAYEKRKASAVKQIDKGEKNWSEWNQKRAESGVPESEKKAGKGFTYSPAEFFEVRGAYTGKLDDAERKAALYYSHIGDTLLNHAHRTGSIADAKNEDLRKMTSTLDGVISKHALEKDTNVKRTIGGEWANAFVAQLKPGSTFTEKGYTSTSATHEYETDSADQVKLNIKMPKGAKAAPIPSNYPSEGEFLLPRGSKFRVVNIKKGKTGTSVDVELIV